MPLHDALGSTLWMVNASGQMQTTFTYTPFGAPSQSGTQSNYPYLFTGREWSDIGGVSQQYYTWARPYSPGLHRFIAPDPIGFAGSGTNLFAYVGNDPIDLSDPTGLSGFFAWVGELFTGGGLNGDVAAGAACSNFFTCVAAIAGTIGYTIYGALAVSGGGGGGHASLPSAPPALLGAQLAQQLARHGFTPQYEVYDWPSPGTHFDPRVRLPYPNGIIPVQFPGYNYCGPGNNGGSTTPGTVDACCKAHDQCYGSLSGLDVLLHPFGIGAGSVQRSCDAQLCGCIQGLGDRGAQGPYDSAMRLGIFGLFCY